jgi:isocitrate dehydrogenase kinase/phosphatase
MPNWDSTDHREVTNAFAEPFRHSFASLIPNRFTFSICESFTASIHPEIFGQSEIVM